MISKEPYTHEAIPLDNGRVYILPIINVASDPPLSAEQEVIKYLWEKLKELAALAPEPNQPKGEGEHTLLTKVYLSTNNVACHSYEVKTFPGGISLGLSDYITGHYEPITEKN